MYWLNLIDIEHVFVYTQNTDFSKLLLVIHGAHPRLRAFKALCKAFYEPRCLEHCHELSTTRRVTEMQIEPIQLTHKRHNYLPMAFLWRGMSHQVARIERVWSREARWARPPRHYFRVRCTNNQVYNIFQDVRLNAWCVER